MSNHHLRNKDLSLKAKGLLSVMLSLPKDWDYSIAGLCSISKENETAIKSTLDELKRFGYVVITKLTPKKTKSGRIEYIYDIYEEPQTKDNEPKQKSCSKKQEGKKQGLEILPLEILPLEIQGLENQGQINTQDQNQDKEKKNIDLDFDFINGSEIEYTDDEIDHIVDAVVDRVMKRLPDKYNFDIRNDVHSRSEIKKIIKYFYQKYNSVKGNTGKHPILRDSSFKKIIQKYYDGIGSDYDKSVFRFGAYQKMIDAYFNQTFGESTNYHLPHFMSDKIRENMYAKVKEDIQKDESIYKPVYETYVPAYHDDYEADDDNLPFS